MFYNNAPLTARTYGSTIPYNITNRVVDKPLQKSPIPNQSHQKSYNRDVIVENDLNYYNSTRNAPTHVNQKSTSSSQQANTNPIGNYILGNVIGEGTFGKVVVATHNDTGEKVAIKILDKSKIKTKDEIERVTREISLLKQIRNSHVIQFYEAIEKTTKLYIVMELASGGELFEYVVRRGHLPENDALRFFRQIVSGLRAIHNSGVCHRDLKPENLLLDQDGNIKIADFGLANSFKSQHSELQERLLDFDISQHESQDNLPRLNTACGSQCYAAPEMIKGTPYLPQPADIWSAGVILYAMLCGHLPFEDNSTNNLYRKILAGEYKLPSHVSTGAKSMLRGLLQVNVNKRLSIKSIYSHPWFMWGANLNSDASAVPQSRGCLTSRGPVEGCKMLERAMNEKKQTVFHSRFTINKHMLTHNKDTNFNCLVDACTACDDHLFEVRKLDYSILNFLEKAYGITTKKICRLIESCKKDLKSPNSLLFSSEFTSYTLIFRKKSKLLRQLVNLDDLLARKSVSMNPSKLTPREYDLISQIVSIFGELAAIGQDRESCSDIFENLKSNITRMIYCRVNNLAVDAEFMRSCIETDDSVLEDQTSIHEEQNKVVDNKSSSVKPDVPSLNLNKIREDEETADIFLSNTKDKPLGSTYANAYQTKNPDIPKLKLTESSALVTARSPVSKVNPVISLQASQTHIHTNTRQGNYFIPTPAPLYVTRVSGTNSIQNPQSYQMSGHLPATHRKFPAPINALYTYRGNVNYSQNKPPTQHKQPLVYVPQMTNRGNSPFNRGFMTARPQEINSMPAPGVPPTPLLTYRGSTPYIYY